MSALAIAKRQYPTHVVANRIDVSGTLPLEIIPGFQLRRGTRDEAAVIRSLIERHCNWFDAEKWFETEVRAEKKDNGTTYSFLPLPPEQFRYWLITQDRQVSDDPFYDGICGIERASRLLDLELEIPFNFHPPGGFGENTLYRRRWNDHECIVAPSPTAVDATYFSEVRRVLFSMQATVKSHPSIRRSIEMYFQLRNIERRYELYLLGLFAILESMLTHDPHGGYDSLGHQIQTKMSLLNRRFERPLRYELFEKVDPDKVWKALYECRSRIAHGGELTFTGRLKPLKGFDSVVSEVSLAVKAVLRLALVEPVLIQDLRAC